MPHICLIAPLISCYFKKKKKNKRRLLPHRVLYSTEHCSEYLQNSFLGKINYSSQFTKEESGTQKVKLPKVMHPLNIESRM